MKIDARAASRDLSRVQVNLPFPMLLENLETVVEMRLQPEIFFSGRVLDHLAPGDVEKAAQRLGAARIPVTFHAPFMDLNPGAVDDRVREVTLTRCHQLLDLAPSFHPRAVVFHPGYDRWRYDGDADLWLERSLLTWEILVARAEKIAVKMALENVFEENPATLRRLLASVNSPFLGYCMDTGHAHLFSRVPLEEWLEALGDRLFEVHLHDNAGEADDHLPPGRGSFDFPRLFARLRQRDLHPILTIEPHEIAHLKPSLEAVTKFLRGEVQGRKNL